jgi:HD superfamily phosphohydrolase
MKNTFVKVDPKLVIFQNRFKKDRRMKSLQHYVDHMNQLLKELIQVATQLRDMSFQVISEEDLEPLQKQQEDLLSQLEMTDQQIQGNYRDQIETKTQAYFHNQLEIFQQLNQEFVQNVNSSQGLIQFELRRLEGEVAEEDLASHLSRLKKTSSTPDSTEAIEPEENE